MVGISHKGSVKAAYRCYLGHVGKFTKYISSEHAPLNSVNVINVSNAILINRKRIGVYQALFLRAGYQAATLSTISSSLYNRGLSIPNVGYDDALMAVVAL